VTLFRFVNSQDNENDWVSVGPGIIVYVAFGLQATSDVFPALVQSVLEFPSQWDAVNQKKISVQEAKGSILIIPQASLLGKLKQKKSPVSWSNRQRCRATIVQSIGRFVHNSCWKTRSGLNKSRRWRVREQTRTKDGFVGSKYASI